MLPAYRDRQRYSRPGERRPRQARLALSGWARRAIRNETGASGMSGRGTEHGRPTGQSGQRPGSWSLDEARRIIAEAGAVAGALLGHETWFRSARNDDVVVRGRTGQTGQTGPVPACGFVLALALCCSPAVECRPAQQETAPSTSPTTPLSAVSHCRPTTVPALRCRGAAALALVARPFSLHCSLSHAQRPTPPTHRRRQEMSPEQQALNSFQGQPEGVLSSSPPP